MARGCVRDLHVQFLRCGVLCSVACRTGVAHTHNHRLCNNSRYSLERESVMRSFRSFVLLATLVSSVGCTVVDYSGRPVHPPPAVVIDPRPRYYYVPPPPVYYPSRPYVYQRPPWYGHCWMENVYDHHGRYRGQRRICR